MQIKALRAFLLVEMNCSGPGVRCAGTSGFEIFVAVGDYIGTNGPHEVVYRVNKNEAVEAGRWGADTEGKAVFVPDGQKSEMLQLLKTGSEITFQVTDFRGSKPYAKFTLAGSSAAIEKLQCL